MLDAKDTAQPSDYPLWLKTYTACLAEQGHETFRGTIWYRRTFATPAVPAGKKLFLLIAGFDDTLTAWVDGTEIGKASSGSFGPALLEVRGLDASKAKHTLVFRITNKGISELGTGGIIRPVCLMGATLCPPPSRSDWFKEDQGTQRARELAMTWGQYCRSDAFQTVTVSPY